MVQEKQTQHHLLKNLGYDHLEALLDSFQEAQHAAFEQNHSFQQQTQRLAAI
jgi:hypothetical protein